MPGMAASRFRAGGADTAILFVIGECAGGWFTRLRRRNPVLACQALLLGAGRPVRLVVATLQRVAAVELDHAPLDNSEVGRVHARARLGEVGQSKTNGRRLLIEGAVALAVHGGERRVRARRWAPAAIGDFRSVR